MKYKFAVKEICYGVISVEADDLEDALVKAESMDGDYFVNKSDVEIIDEIY